jgi:hypothetical protein
MSQQNNFLRKRFLWWGAAALASLSISGLFRKRKAVRVDTIKMLSEDGSLVEIDKRHITSASKPVTNKELQHWIKNKPKSKSYEL